MVDEDEAQCHRRTVEGLKEIWTAIGSTLIEQINRSAEKRATKFNDPLQKPYHDSALPSLVRVLHRSALAETDFSVPIRIPGDTRQIEVRLVHMFDTGTTLSDGVVSKSRLDKRNKSFKYKHTGLSNEINDRDFCISFNYDAFSKSSNDTERVCCVIAITSIRLTHPGGRPERYTTGNGGMMMEVGDAKHYVKAVGDELLYIEMPVARHALVNALSSTTPVADQIEMRLSADAPIPEMSLPLDQLPLISTEPVSCNDSDALYPQEDAHDCGIYGMSDAIGDAIHVQKHLSSAAVDTGKPLDSDVLRKTDNHKREMSENSNMDDDVPKKKTPVQSDACSDGDKNWSFTKEATVTPIAPIATPGVKEQPPNTRNKRDWTPAALTAELMYEATTHAPIAVHSSTCASTAAVALPSPAVASGQTATSTSSAKTVCKAKDNVPNDAKLIDALCRNDIVKYACSAAMPEEVATTVAMISEAGAVALEAGGAVVTRVVGRSALLCGLRFLCCRAVGVVVSAVCSPVGVAVGIAWTAHTIYTEVQARRQQTDLTNSQQVSDVNDVVC